MEGLNNAKKAGKQLLSSDELLKITKSAEITTPKINSIDQTIESVKRGLKIIKGRGHIIIPSPGGGTCSFCEGGYINYTLAKDITGISRKTFYRWEKTGLLNTRKQGRSKVFNLQELKNTLEQIQRKKPHKGKS
jgi:hypothetical protein